MANRLSERHLFSGGIRFLSETRFLEEIGFLRQAARVAALIRDYRDTLAFGLLLEAGLVVLLAITGLYRGSPLLEIFFWLPFAIYVLAIGRVGRAETIAAPGQTGAVILGFALLFHVTLLFSSAPLSNDIYRYYWDGKTTNNGFNPYAYSPDADALRPLRDANWEEVMNKDVHTMYPPLAQVAFAIAYASAPGTWSLRLCSVSFNLLAGGLLILILMKLGLDIRYSIIYAWSPLATIEFANSGHIDSLAVLFTMLSFWALLDQKKTLSAAALALAVLSKIFPLLFAGLFFPRWGKRGVVVFGAVLAVFYLPFLGAGAQLIQGSSYFVDRGLFNGSLFPLLAGIIEQILWRPDALRAAKALVVVAFVGLLVILFFRARAQSEDNLVLWKYSYWLTGAFLLTTPTMHPWYLTWLLPFLCFFRSAAWIFLTGAVVLARSIYIGYEATGAWSEIGWIRFVEYVPFFLLLAWGPFRRLLAWINEDAEASPAWHGLNHVSK